MAKEIFCGKKGTATMNILILKFLTLPDKFAKAYKYLCV
jgi:hypothetical protein